MSVHFVRTNIPALEVMRAVRFRSAGTQHTIIWRELHVSVRLCRNHRNAVRSSRTFGALSSFGGEAARLNRRLDERKKMEGEQDESGIEQSNG